MACGRTAANFGVIINLINGGVECGPGAGNPEAARNRVAFLQEIAEEMGGHPGRFSGRLFDTEKFRHLHLILSRKRAPAGLEKASGPMPTTPNWTG